MNVLLFGASGRIRRRIADELLERRHAVTGVSRSGEVRIDHLEFKSVAGDATDPNAVAKPADGYDAIASTLGPGENPEVHVLTDLVEVSSRDSDEPTSIDCSGSAAPAVSRPVRTRR